MRQISAQALTYLTTQHGIEPINIVEIQWTSSTTILYSDRTINNNIRGRILTLSDLENVVNVSKNNSTQSISLTLDDADGSIKNIYNNNDIHKRPVKVYQWFNGIPLEDKFTIFEGEINSPIVWKEGDRTLSFEVVSKLEDVEVGFSPEEGTFSTIPEELIGKAWPLPFGVCLKIPCIKIDPIPVGVTLDTNLIPDPSIADQIAKLGKVISEMLDTAKIYLFAAVAAQYKGMGDNLASDEDDDEQLMDLSDQLADKATECVLKANQASWDLAALIQQQAYQRDLAKKNIRVSGGSCFPQGQEVQANIGGSTHTGVMAGDSMTITGATHPGASSGSTPTTVQVPIEQSIIFGGQDNIQKLDFFWIPAGRIFKFTSNLAVRFVVAMIPVSVRGVFAYRNIGDTRILMELPTEYYNSVHVAFGTISATVVTLVKPLSYYNDNWDDSLYVDVVSSVGSNTVTILKWIIEHYTSLAWDPTTFAQVTSQVAPFPSNFCLMERKNVLAVLKEIAYQARCAIWLKDGVFYIRFLRDEPTPVDTITEDDIILNTLELHHSSTEEIITKLTAEYVTNYAQDKKFKIILRNNVSKYGTQEESEDWYTYARPNLVDLAATFWIIRKSNTWKLLRFKTPIHKLRLEAFDAVTINFSTNWSHIGAITGIVESVKFDSDNLQCEFEVWLPVRLGEMTKYDFAWPIDSEIRVYPGDRSITTPGSGANGNLEAANRACTPGPQYPMIKQGKRRRMHDGAPNPGTNNINGEILLQPVIAGMDTSARPGSDYRYRNYAAVAFEDVATVPATYPAQIVSGDGPEYKLKVYLKGLAHHGSQTSGVNVDHKGKLSAGTWVMLTVVVWAERNGTQVLKKSEKVFLPAIGKNVYPGKVLAGSGHNYTVELYKNGTSGAPESVSGVKQLQIDNTDAIPAGAWTLVAEGTNAGEVEYTMQLPVWQE